MALAPGTRLGAYEILMLIGSGGMGEVYRARDTRLDRTVAVKVLPVALAADSQLRERFEREARAVSSLQHPHICALFDVGRDGDHEFLVLEYLEGETIADRLVRSGALPIADALKIASEICDALDRAHRSGIVHRDLKPANVMLTKAGAKLLDFGLAKATAPVVASSGLSMMPTTPPNMTTKGTILGTFQYMAPEQLEGLEADARTDIFAFGALVFEMVTARTAFEGKTRASLLGAILKDEPPRISQLQPLAPPMLDRIVATCLAKDPDDRYQSARDLLRDVKCAMSDGMAAAPAPISARRTRRGRALTVLVAASLLLVGAAAGALLMRQFRPLTGTEPIQFTIPAPDQHLFGGPLGGGTGQVAQLALSHDSRQLAFVAADKNVFQLWIRSAGAIAPRLIPGTDGASFPFWSPDDRYVAFFADGKLEKVAVSGGPALVLCDAAGSRGGTWSADNVIVFGSTVGALWRVSAAGGISTPASKLDAAYGDAAHRWPHFLPDGRHFLFTATIGICCPPPKPAAIRIGSLDSMDTVTLFQAESAVEYASGHLLFSRAGTLMAQAFDPVGRRFTGDAFPIAERVNGEGSRYASFSVSTNGVLAYAHGGAQTSTRLTWRDRAGNILGTIGEAMLYMHLALSPDERRIAVTLPSATVEDRDVWIIDTLRGTTSRLTFEPGADIAPVWSPDGTRIAFQAVRNGALGLRQKLVAGATNDEPLLDERGNFLPTDWSADGRFIAFNRAGGPSGTGDVWVLPLSGDKKPFPIAQTPFAEAYGTFAPNGHWIAYQSNESGPLQIYVQPFPATGGKYQVSRNGGTQPTWRSDGKELFFLAPDNRLMAAAIDSTRQFEMGVPQPLFASDAATTGGRQYAVSKDGKRFLINMLTQQTSTEPITVVVNWLSGVQK